MGSFVRRGMTTGKFVSWLQDADYTTFSIIFLYHNKLVMSVVAVMTNRWGVAESNEAENHMKASTKECLRSNQQLQRVAMLTSNKGHWGVWL